MFVGCLNTHFDFKVGIKSCLQIGALLWAFGHLHRPPEIKRLGAKLSTKFLRMKTRFDSLLRIIVLLPSRYNAYSNNVFYINSDQTTFSLSLSLCICAFSLVDIVPYIIISKESIVAIIVTVIGQCTKKCSLSHLTTNIIYQRNHNVH